MRCSQATGRPRPADQAAPLTLIGREIGNAGRHQQPQCVLLGSGSFSSRNCYRTVTTYCSDGKRGTKTETCSGTRGKRRVSWQCIGCQSSHYFVKASVSSCDFSIYCTCLARLLILVIDDAVVTGGGVNPVILVYSNELRGFAVAWVRRVPRDSGTNSECISTFWLL